MVLPLFKYVMWVDDIPTESYEKMLKALHEAAYYLEANCRGRMGIANERMVENFLEGERDD
jgi:hypothetical protein